jgi:hypothetical protein
LRRREAQNSPSSRFERIITAVVLGRAFCIRVPGVAVSFKIEIAIRTIDDKIEFVPLLLDINELLSFRKNLSPLEFSPQSVFKRAAVIKIVDLRACLGSLIVFSLISDLITGYCPQHSTHS